MRRSDAWMTNRPKAEAVYPGAVVAFTLEEIAQVVHDANRRIQIITGDPVPSRPWDEAPRWQQDSAVEGVRAALRGLTPREMHEEWVRSKERQGWAYGEWKDEELKTHPCMVPYDRLPEEQRAKDALFVAVVQALT